MRGLDASSARIIVRHRLPGTIALVIVAFVHAAAAILIESALRFVGMGDPIRKS